MFGVNIKMKYLLISVIYVDNHDFNLQKNDVK